MKNIFMQHAIDKAWRYQLLTYPNPAVGACVTKDNQILSIEAHKEAGFPHAEVLALKSAFLTKYQDKQLESLISSLDIHNYLVDNHNNFFHDCEIFVTLEPCNHFGRTPACSSLLKAIGIKKVYIGSLDPNNNASGGVSTLIDSGIPVETGILKEESDNLLIPFVRWHLNSFIFFKLAIREDGSCDGGYITSQDSLNFVHEIRSMLDLLVIGGNTVRIDRPKLDSRFSKKDEPSDVLIYSRKKDFDQTIPLFSIPNRRVYISNDLSILKNENMRFIMIEGGFSLLDIIKNKIDMLVLFVSHRDLVKSKFNIDELGFKTIYSYMINEFDELFFLIK